MRLIDADALRKNAQHAKDISKWYGELLVVGLGHILNAPTISPRPDWTPCAEGLPKNQGQYQCTIKDSRLATWLKVEPINMLGVRYFYDGRWYNGDDVDPDVIAWQPLPDPYNPDRKEDAKWQE